MFRRLLGATPFGSSPIPGYLTLCTGVVLIGIGVSVVRPYLSLFGTDVIHMNPAQLGIFMCLNALGGIVFSTWMGKMSDARTPKKDIMLVAAACSGLGYLSFLVFHNYLVLLVVSTLLLGLGAAAFPQLFAYAREATSGLGDATMAISTLRSFFSLAWVIGPLLGAWVLAALGYNGLFIFTAIVFVFVFFLILLRLRRRPSAGIRKSDGVGLFGHLRRPDLLTSFLGSVAANIAISMNGTYMPLFLTRTLGAPSHDVGFVFSLSAGLEIPIMLGLGTVANRVGKRILMMVGSICGTLYYLGAAFAHAPWEMLVLQLLCATFISIYVSIGMSYFQDFMPDSPGSATTLFSNTGSIGSLVGSLLGGAIAQAISFRSVYWFCAALGFLSFVFLIRRRGFISQATLNSSAPTQNRDGGSTRAPGNVEGGETV